LECTTRPVYRKLRAVAALRFNGPAVMSMKPGE
jgi:hypothetical protein